MLKEVFLPTAHATIGTLIVLFSLQIAYAQVMQSGNYQIKSDSINIGGRFSSSTNYTVESTGGEVATGRGESANYSLRAGYQQMQAVYISISNASDVSLSPSLPGMTGGVSLGFTTVAVITDSPSGYALTIAATTNPAMQKGVDSIPNYAPAGGAPDFVFTTGAGQSHFGYSPDGVDIVQTFKDNGSLCNVGSLTTAAACWDGLDTTATLIASDTDANHPLGATTTISFKVGIGNGAAQAEGEYTATTTLTALPL